MKKLISLILIVLVVAMPIYAADLYSSTQLNPTTYPQIGSPYRLTDYGQYYSSTFGNLMLGTFTGEAINVYIDHYEPTVLTTNLIEQDDVPIFAFLKANTLGSYLGVEDAKFEPLYGAPLIRNIEVRSTTTNQYIKDRPVYIRPQQTYQEGSVLKTTYEELTASFSRSPYSLENIGMLIIWLKRIEKEKDIPDYIDINLTATIYYDTEKSLFMGEEDLRLMEQSDEDKWLGGAAPSNYPTFSLQNLISNKNTAQNWLTRTGGKVPTLADVDGQPYKVSFLNGVGYIRADKVSLDSASFELYDGSLFSLGSTGTLKIGETSRYFPLNLGGVYAYGDQFRVMLVDIIDAAEQKARIFVNVGGLDGKNKLVGVGQNIYEGSNWVVGSINIEEKDEKIIEKVNLVNSITNEKLTISRDYNKDNKTEDGETGAGKDPCERVKEYLELSDEAFLDKLKEQNDPKQQKVILYCKSIKEFEVLHSKYGNLEGLEGISYKDWSGFYIGQIYNRMIQELDILSEEEKNFAKKGAYEAYDSMDDRSLLNEDSSVMKEALKNEVSLGITYGDGQFKETDKTVDIRLMGIEGDSGAPESKKSVDVYVNNNLLSFKVGNIVTDNWKITKIEEKRIKVENETESKFLSLNEDYKLNGNNVKIARINVNRIALVRILPGISRAISESNFYLRIPIEKRLFNLTTEQIDSQINKTQNIIEKLNRTIVKLEKFVTNWRKLCVMTYGVIWLKNLFSGVTGARQAVMRGYQGKTGWALYCEKYSGVTEGSLYKSYDQCMFENSEYIGKQIDALDKATDLFNKQAKEGAENTDAYKELYKIIQDNNPGLLEDTEGLLLTPEDVKEYVYLKTFVENKPTDLEKTKTFYDQKGGEYKNLVDSLNNKGKAYVEATKNLAGFEFSEEEKKIAFREAFKDELNKVSGVPTEETKIDTKELSNLLGVEEIKKVTYLLSEKDGKKIFPPPNYQPVKVKVVNYEDLSAIKDYDYKATLQIKQKVKEKPKQPVSVENSYLYKSDKDEYYIVMSAEVLGEGIRNDYAPGATAEFTSDGRPYCIPTGEDGNYIQVLEEYQDGTPKTLRILNVGSDGLLCTADDKLVMHESVLNLQKGELQKYTNIVIQARNLALQQGKTFSIRGKQFPVSNSKSQEYVDLNEPHCTDVMGINDCKLLFNICDPVMCPKSRFNLGGRWYVKDVVQTGIVGSIVLGLPNWGSDQVVPPICLTGILAGLKNWNSILEGYKQCLISAKMEGTSVGICDRIRNLFFCEIAWKEFLGIINVVTGLIKGGVGAVKRYDKGGGEYFNFKGSLDNAAESFKYFTTEYAGTFYAAYQARSTADIGTEICKSFINSKIPGVGEFVDQFAKPSDPPQFTATFSEFPYAESLGMSKYSVYYHIYAGTNPYYYTGYQGVMYSVFLRDGIGRIFYVTDGLCDKVARSRLEQGGFADRNVDCVFPKGVTELCVEINGITECGFGRVSSGFTLNWFNDQILAEESAKEISSEDECIPDEPGIGSSLSSLFVPGVTTSVNGIVRVCSPNNPGLGTSEDRWKPIGTCGKDQFGHDLGYCWLDLKSVSIKDVKTAEEVKNKIEEVSQDYPVEGSGKEIGVEEGSELKTSALTGLGEEEADAAAEAKSQESKEEAKSYGILAASELRDNIKKAEEKGDKVTAAESQFSLALSYLDEAIKIITIKKEEAKPVEMEAGVEGELKEEELEKIEVSGYDERRQAWLDKLEGGKIDPNSYFEECSGANCVKEVPPSYAELTDFFGDKYEKIYYWPKDKSEALVLRRGPCGDEQCYYLDEDYKNKFDVSTVQIGDRFWLFTSLGKYFPIEIKEYPSAVYYKEPVEELKTELKPCEDCDTVWKGCSYEKCHEEYGPNCFYRGDLWLFRENCVDCEKGGIESCSDYSKKIERVEYRIKECGTNPCGVKNGCEWDEIKGECVETKTKKLIVVDPGHGGNDPGAIAPDGTQEKDINLKIAEKLKSSLEEKDFDVIMTRDSDINITIGQRYELANEKKADLFVSIHSNSVEPEGAWCTSRGTETHINCECGNDNKGYCNFADCSDSRSAKFTESMLLAQNIDSSLSGFNEYKGTFYRNDLGVLKGTEMPAILIEVDYLCNREALSFLKDQQNQNRFVDVITDVIVNHA
jgi:N-acetylmuramoyl-L-alanine amidase